MAQFNDPLSLAKSIITRPGEPNIILWPGKRNPQKTRFSEKLLHLLSAIIVNKLIKTNLFQKIDASAIEDFYGLTSDIQKSSETGYILFYQSRDASC